LSILRRSGFVSEAVKVPWCPSGAWDGIAAPGRTGAPDGDAGVFALPLEHYGMATIIARRGVTRELAEHFANAYGVTLPVSPAVAMGRDCARVWAGPAQWLAVSSDRALPKRLAQDLIQGLNGMAAVSDQSDGRALLNLRGARLGDAFAKGCPIDLHPRAFAAGGAAVTVIGHIGVHLWQLPSDDGLHVAVFRSMAGSFWSWLRSSAAEFGFECRGHSPG
jgi:methylglutamate dehydrogenase subunit D